MIRAGIKRGSAQMVILSVLRDGPLHGYEIARCYRLTLNGRRLWLSAKNGRNSSMLHDS